MSSAGFRSLYFSAYNQFYFLVQIYQFTSHPRIAYLANVCAQHKHDAHTAASFE